MLLAPHSYLEPICLNSDVSLDYYQSKPPAALPHWNLLTPHLFLCVYSWESLKSEVWGYTDLLFCRESGVWSNLVTRKEEDAVSDTKSTVNIPILIVYKYIELYESCHVWEEKLCILRPRLFPFFLPISAIWQTTMWHICITKGREQNPRERGSSVLDSTKFSNHTFILIQ